MKFEKVTLPAMIVIGSELRTTWQNGACFTEIPAFWEQKRRERIWEKIPNQEYPSTIFGLYTNYSHDFSLTTGHYSLIIGCPVMTEEIIPSGMIAVEIPETHYAVFTAQGPFEKAVPQTWAEIWKNTDLKRTFKHDFEWYNALSTDDENSIVNIYVSIE
jgi:AraC family transcriptional regulator